MARKEVATDLWVAKLLDDSRIGYTPQGSSIKEVSDALKSASKRKTGNTGYPEYVALVNDFLIVIEDKADTSKHVKYTATELIDLDGNAISDFAVNGAVHYAKHIASNSSFHKIFAIGVSGTEKQHRISPVYVDDRDGYKELPELDSFVSFSEANISEYYYHYVLDEPTDIERTTEQILKDAAELHEALRTYGSVKDQDKPLIVSGILLALDEVAKGGFSIDSLTGDQVRTDGQKIVEAIKNRLVRSNVGPDAKKDKVMAEFAVIKTNFKINEVDSSLGKTPLRYYTEFLYDRVFKCIKYQSTSEDFIGRFYGEFMSYSGGDGQSLGIVLTPKHITDLMCDLVHVSKDDIVLDGCCGTAGFLISAMHKMLNEADGDEEKQREIKKRQLHGFELQSNMFAIAVTNMVLRNDGNSNLECCDFLAKPAAKTQLKGATVGLLNPPYSMAAKTKDKRQYEICFVKHLLDSLITGGRCAVIVPQSTMTGKTKAEQEVKRQLLKEHTLEGVITCNPNTFYGVGTNPCIAVFTAHEPHPKSKICKFISFQNDGFEVRKHVGLIPSASVTDKKQHLLDVWEGRVEAPNSFCMLSAAQSDDEWLHSFYYFNDAIPADSEFDKAIGEYLSFEFSMIMNGRGYLFEGVEEEIG